MTLQEAIAMVQRGSDEEGDAYPHIYNRARVRHGCSQVSQGGGGEAGSGRREVAWPPLLVEAVPAGLPPPARSLPPPNTTSHITHLLTDSLSIMQLHWVRHFVTYWKDKKKKIGTPYVLS